MFSFDEIRRHLDLVKDKKLDPATYQEKDYILRDSIRTDGFRVQLIVFTLRELQDVRCRRLDESRLPERLTSGELTIISKRSETSSPARRRISSL